MARYGLIEESEEEDVILGRSGHAPRSYPKRTDRLEEEEAPLRTDSGKPPARRTGRLRQKVQKEVKLRVLFRNLPGLVGCAVVCIFVVAIRESCFFCVFCSSELKKLGLDVEEVQLLSKQLRVASRCTFRGLLFSCISLVFFFLHCIATDLGSELVVRPLAVATSEMKSISRVSIESMGKAPQFGQ